MTVIVGITDEYGNVWFGADRGAFDSSGDEYYVSPTPKIFKRQISIQRVDKTKEKINILVGTSGSWRFGDIIEDFDFESLVMQEGDTPKKFIRKILIKALQDELIASDYRNKDYQILIGIQAINDRKAKIFEIQDDLSVMDVPEYGHAIGAGSTPAMSAVYVISKLKNKLQPKEIIEMSLAAAEAIITTVRGPFDIFSTNQ